MMRHNVQDGVLTVDVFTCKQRINAICSGISKLMSQGQFTSSFVIVRFHSQRDWVDYAEFTDGNVGKPIRMSALGVIVRDEEEIDRVEWRAGLLRPLGIKVGVFKT